MVRSAWSLEIETCIWSSPGLSATMVAQARASPSVLALPLPPTIVSFALWGIVDGQVPGKEDGAEVDVDEGVDQLGQVLVPGAAILLPGRAAEAIRLSDLGHQRQFIGLEPHEARLTHMTPIGWLQCARKGRYLENVEKVSPGGDCFTQRVVLVVTVMAEPDQVCRLCLKLGMGTPCCEMVQLARQPPR